MEGTMLEEFLKQENESPNLPHDGIVSMVRIQNLLDFVDIKKTKPFLMLSRLEEMLLGEKIRKIQKTIQLKDEVTGGLVIFQLTGFEKIRKTEGIDNYTVTYRYSAIV